MLVYLSLKIVKKLFSFGVLHDKFVNDNLICEHYVL